MSGWTAVVSTRDPFEVELVRGLLEGAGIPVRVARTGLQGLDYIFGTTRFLPGQIQVLVPDDHVYFARTLLRTPPEEPTGETPPEGAGGESPPEGASGETPPEGQRP